MNSFFNLKVIKSFCSLKESYKYGFTLVKNGSSKKPEAKQDKNAEDKQKHRQSGMVKSSGKNSRHQVFIKTLSY